MGDDETKPAMKRALDSNTVKILSLRGHITRLENMQEATNQKLDSLALKVERLIEILIKNSPVSALRKIPEDAAPPGEEKKT
jgi:hypothetical protein